MNTICVAAVSKSIGTNGVFIALSRHLVAATGKTCQRILEITGGKVSLQLVLSTHIYMSLFMHGDTPQLPVKQC